MKIQRKRFERGYTFVKKQKIYYEWKINDLSSYSVEEDNNEKKYKLDLESPKFSAGADKEKKWYLRLKSENQESEDQKWLSLYLHYSASKKADTSIKTKYSLFILNSENERVNTAEFYKFFRNDGDGWICSEFVKKEDLVEKSSELLPNDTLTIGVELTVYNGPANFSNRITLKNPPSQMSADYRRLLESKEGSDVVFKVKDQSFEAHKTILMARSEMFLKMFTLEMKENKEHLITLTDIEPEIFKSLLEFIYTGEVTDLDIFVEDLLEPADKYLLTSLKDLCSKTLLKQLKVDNAVRFLSLAERHNIPELSAQISEFIIRNVVDVIKTPEFKIMERSNPSLGFRLFDELKGLIADGTFEYSYIEKGN